MKQELNEIGSASASLLINLKHGKQQEQVASMEALVKIGSPAVEALTQMLEEPDELLRVRVCQIIWRIGDSRPVPSLIRLLQTGSAREKAAAAGALAVVEDPGDCRAADALKIFLRGAARTYYEYEVSALAALRHCKNPNLVPFFSEYALSTTYHVEVRAAACLALGECETESAMSPLIKLCDEQEPIASLRWEATKQLARLCRLYHNPIGEQKVTEVIDSYIAALPSNESGERLNAAYRLGQLGPAAWRATDPLQQCLNHDIDKDTKAIIHSTLKKIQIEGWAIEGQ